MTQSGGTRLPGLAPRDLPAIWAAAEAQSQSAQRRYLLLMRSQIVLPLFGVTIGALGSAATLGILAAASTVVIASLRLLQRSTGVETVWYESRAMAEAVKTLAWRYAVRGSPFQLPEQTDEEADELFASELAKIVDDRELAVPPRATGEITAGMRSLRASQPEVRREAYVRDRVEDQLNWYAVRAQRSKRLADWWDLSFYLVASVAVISGVLLATQQDETTIGPIVSLAAGAAGAVIAWIGVRRYASLAHAYAGVATQLSLSAAVAAHQDTTEEWVAFVDHIEGLLGRENEQWRSARR